MHSCESASSYGCMRVHGRMGASVYERVICVWIGVCVCLTSCLDVGGGG